MKYVKLLLVIPLFIAQLSFAADQPKDEWYPFYFPEKLDPDSPLNIGKLVLDAPAGKHGFVKVKDGHFYFEDGTRAKFWGTNLCMSACFPTHKEAEMLAGRIAYFGFNAVRLHHMDFGFEPKGIFKDVAPAMKDPQQKPTDVLSEAQLDKLDYLIYQLKVRGIYVDMNLLVSRHFTEADGVKNAAELGIAAKPISIFDPKLIELQKKYAKDLLSHNNPYTKLKYCNDPAIALIEITNENSIFSYWKWDNLNGSFLGVKKNSIPNYYVKMLDEKWNKWLKEKYGSIENVKKSWISNISTKKINNPSSLILDQSKWVIEKHDDALATKDTTNNQTSLKIESITSVPWHIQYKYTGINIQNGRKYILKFMAKGDKNMSIGIACQQNFAPWDGLGLSETFKLTDDFKLYEIPFFSTNDCENSKITFIIGYNTGIITLKNISLVEASDEFYMSQDFGNNFNFTRPLYKLLNFYPKNEALDIKYFYIDLEKSYFNEILSFLKKELGVSVPITGVGGYPDPNDIESQEQCDFIDTHAYWDHPRFPNKSWDANDFRIHNRSMLLDPTLGIIGQVISHDPNKLTTIKKRIPYTITEWNHCYPNQYSYETPLLIAAEATKNEWDALFQFAFSHGWKTTPKMDIINGFFDIMGDAQRLLLTGYGAIIYLSGDTVNFNVQNGILTINTSKIDGKIGFIKGEIIEISGHKTILLNNGAIIILDIQNHSYATCLGVIKNSGSGWNLKQEKYTWGDAPTVMQKVVSQP